jgi:hypothetical protein
VDALESARAKLRRANEHLEALNQQAGQWLDSKPYTFEKLVLLPSQANGEPIYFEFKLASVEREPPNLGLLLGDCISNLRAALDHIAWQFVLKSCGGIRPSKKEARWIYFPSSTTYKNFRGRALFKYLSYRERLAIQRHQPYKRRRTPLLHPIAELIELSNADKHEAVHATLISIEKMGPEFSIHDGVIERAKHAFGTPLEQGTYVASVWLRPTGPYPNVEMERVAVAIAFGEGSTIRLGSIPTMAEEVAAILADCEPFFR